VCLHRGILAVGDWAVHLGVYVHLVGHDGLRWVARRKILEVVWLCRGIVSVAVVEVEVKGSSRLAVLK
jgi:hypothetical protein